jgi:hypothetical protein
LDWYFILKLDKNKAMNLFELKSVGSWLDYDKGVVYPSLKKQRYFVRSYNSDTRLYDDVYLGKNLCLAEEKYDLLVRFFPKTSFQKITFTIADLDYPISLIDGEVSEEWYSKLSERDYDFINHFMPQLELDKKK